jgi:hypothetical protein
MNNRLYICICHCPLNGIFQKRPDSTDVYQCSGQDIYAIEAKGEVQQDSVSSVLSFVLSQSKKQHDEIYFIIHAKDIGINPSLDRYITDIEYQNNFNENNPKFQSVINELSHFVIVFTHGSGKIKDILGKTKGGKRWCYNKGRIR